MEQNGRKYQDHLPVAVNLIIPWERFFSTKEEMDKNMGWNELSGGAAADAAAAANVSLPLCVSMQ